MMLASELIKQLQALVDEYGDKPVDFPDHEEGGTFLNIMDIKPFDIEGAAATKQNAEYFTIFD